MKVLLVLALVVFGAVFLLAFHCVIAAMVIRFFVGLFKFCYGLSKVLIFWIILFLLVAIATLVK